MTISIVERNGLSLASGIGFLTLMAAFCYGNAIGVPVRAMMENAKYSHPKLERRSPITTFDANDPNIDPMLARDFVLYVLQNALDGNPSTATQNQRMSLGWMYPQAKSTISKSFWETPKPSKICFVSQTAEPTTNSKGPVITVKVQGYLHDHIHSPASHHPFNMTVYVVKGKTGLRLNDISLSKESTATLNELANE